MFQSFCFLVCFSEGGLMFLPRLVSDHDSPTSTSGVAGIMGVYHHTQLIRLLYRVDSSKLDS
jgi:hypothetical protein